MYPHPLWAYLNRALHAPTREKVWDSPIRKSCVKVKSVVFFGSIILCKCSSYMGTVIYSSILIIELILCHFQAQSLKCEDLCF